MNTKIYPGGYMTNAETNQDLADIIQLVSFKLAEEEFGVDILLVQEINKMMQITKVPNAPKFVDGVANLRGRIIPIIDLRTRLGMRKKEKDAKSRIIVVELANYTVGFTVDEVLEVLRIPKETLEKPPAMLLGINSDYITSVAKMDDRLLVLLELEKVFTPVEAKKLAENA